MRTFANIVLALSLLIFGSVCFVYGVADFYYQRAKTAYSALDQQQLEYSDDLAFIVDDVDRSLRWRPNAANSLSLKADLLFQSWWLSPDGQYLGQSNLLQQSLSYHMAALDQRSNWAFSVAQIAIIYSQQPELDADFNTWFSKAHQLGLYETKIARSLMVFGLQRWNQLSSQQKDITLDFIRVSIEQKVNSAAYMQRVLDTHGIRDYVCQRLDDTQRKNAVCAIDNN